MSNFVAVPRVPRSVQIPRGSLHPNPADPAGDPHQGRGRDPGVGGAGPLAAALLRRPEDPAGVRRDDQEPRRSLAADHPNSGLDDAGAAQHRQARRHAAGVGGGPAGAGHHLQPRRGEPARRRQEEEEDDQHGDQGDDQQEHDDRRGRAVGPAGGLPDPSESSGDRGDRLGAESQSRCLLGDLGSGRGRPERKLVHRLDLCHFVPLARYGLSHTS